MDFIPYKINYIQTRYIKTRKKAEFVKVLIITQ